MNQYKYYLFDYDGTICNTFPTIHHAMRQTFEKSGLIAPDSATMLTAVSKGGALHDTLRYLHPDASLLNFDDVEMIAKIYREQYKECEEKLTVLFDGADTVFNKLKEQGKTIIVLSNKGIAAVERSLQSLHLFDLTDLVIAEGAFPELGLKSKPDPMIYKTLIRPKYKIKSDHEVLMIGDTHTDILFANNCGIASCWAAYGYGQKDACEVLHPTYTIQNISAII